MRNYKFYPKLPSCEFTLLNSIRFKHENIIDYFESDKGCNEWCIIGYTLNPPFDTHYPAVAIMFENKKTFEKYWCHYSLDFFKDDEVKPHKIDIKDVRSRKV